MEVQGLSGKPSTPATGSEPNLSAIASTAAPAGESESPTRPEWVPEQHWDAEAGSLKLDEFGAHYAELTAAQKAEQDRLAALPQKPEDVKFSLPEGYTLPDGATINENDPMLAEARKIVVDKKIDPAAANEFYGLYVKKQAEDFKAISARIGEEKKKLGTNPEARVDAVRQSLTAAIGKAYADELSGDGKLWTAGQVLALEAIAKKLSSQGGASPPAASHTPPKQELSWQQKLWPNRFAAR